MDQEQVWTHLRNKYFNQFLQPQTGIDEWPKIKARLEVLDDLRRMLNKLSAMTGREEAEIDNA